MGSIVKGGIKFHLLGGGGGEVGSRRMLIST